MVVTKQVSIPSSAKTSGLIPLLSSTQSLARAQGGIKGFGFDHVPPKKARYLISWPWLASTHRKKYIVTTLHVSLMIMYLSVISGYKYYTKFGWKVHWQSTPAQASVPHRNKWNAEKPWTCFSLWGISKFLSSFNPHLKNCLTFPVVADIL